MLMLADITTAVSYINHQGGLHLCPLFKLVQQILFWAQVKFLSLRVVYIPGHSNMEADILSRRGLKPGRLHPKFNLADVRQSGSVPICSEKMAHCHHWFSLICTSATHVTSLQVWLSACISPDCYAFLVRVCQYLLLVTPFWVARLWFFDVISLLEGSPWGILIRWDLLSQALGRIFHSWLKIRNPWAGPLWSTSL